MGKAVIVKSAVTQPVSDFCHETTSTAESPFGLDIWSLNTSEGSEHLLQLLSQISSTHCQTHLAAMSAEVFFFLSPMLWRSSLNWAANLSAWLNWGSTNPAPWLGPATGSRFSSAGSGSGSGNSLEQRSFSPPRVQWSLGGHFPRSAHIRVDSCRNGGRREDRHSSALRFSSAARPRGDLRRGCAVGEERWRLSGKQCQPTATGQWTSRDTNSLCAAPVASMQMPASTALISQSSGKSSSSQASLISFTAAFACKRKEYHHYLNLASSLTLS